jgi:hypothetical protein
MNTRNEILKELQELNSPLAGLEPVNVFTVPQGYFDNFGSSVLRAINGGGILKSITQPGPADVPEGYFDTLAGSIMDKIKQQAAQNEEEPALSPLLQSLKHKNVFEVPQGYFEGLAANISANLPAKDSDELPAVLQGLKHKNVFEVPQGYFNGFAATVMARLEPQGAKVVTMRKRFSVVKYAVAAALVGVMALGVYKIAGTGGTGEGIKLSEVHENGIALSKDEAKYNTAFDQVSDEAIVQFLETNGQDVDAALAAVAVDEKELPAEDELILDEKTLDNFLNNIDDKDLNN